MRRHAPATPPAHARHRHHGPSRPERLGAASWRPAALLGLAGLVVGLLLFSAGAAFAYFMTTDSSNPAEAVAATLNAPGAGQQNGKDRAGAVAIGWTAPSGYTPTGYVVSRCAGSSCTDFAAIAAGNCSGTLTKTSCTDNQGLAVGTIYSYEVTADLHSWQSPANAPFQGTTAGATTMAFTTQPSAGQQIQATSTFNVSVTIEDANGTPDTSDSTDSVTLAIDPSHDPGSGTLTCNGGLTTAASKGVATFKKCTINKVGSGYQLTASSSNSALAAPVNANSFTIIAGNPAQIAATSGGSQTAGTSAAFTNPVTVTVVDADGNPVPGASVTFTAPSNGASATFGTSSACTPSQSGTSCVATTDSNGVATSSTFTASAKGGTYKISASTPGAGQVTFAETNQPDTSISALSTADGSGTAGQIGAGDTITVGFSGPIDPSTVCSGWTGSGSQSASAGSVVTVSGGGSGDDVLKFTQGPTACGTFRFGTIDLGSGQYYVPPSKGGNLTFSGSAIAYGPTADTLTITLGTMTNPGTLNKVSAGSSLVLSLSAGILDAGDNALTGPGTYTTVSGVQF